MPMMAPNNYCGVLIGWELGQADNEKRTPYMALKWSVTHQAGDGQWQEIQPVERTMYLYLSDRAWPHSRDRLTALGFTGQFDAIQFAANALTDPIELRCSHEDNNKGGLREQWDLANFSRASRQVSPADAPTVQKLNALWRTDQQTAQPPTGRPTPPRMPTAGPTQPTQPETGAAAPGQYSGLTGPEVENIPF